MKKEITTKQCINLLKENDTSKIIFLHSKKVNAVAKLLADMLQKKGIILNQYLIDKASLLHDVRKAYGIQNQRDEFHEEDGALLLKRLGFGEIGKLILKHKTDQILKEEGLSDWESKIVYYADKRVQHESIVSIKERINNGKMRYPHLSDLLEQVFPLIIELEKQIFKNLDIKPEDINEEMIKPYLIDYEY